MGSVKAVLTCQKPVTPQISMQTIGVTSLQLSHGIKLAERDFGKQSSLLWRTNSSNGKRMNQYLSTKFTDLSLFCFLPHICFLSAGTVIASEKPNSFNQIHRTPDHYPLAKIIKVFYRRTRSGPVSKI